MKRETQPRNWKHEIHWEGPDLLPALTRRPSFARAQAGDVQQCGSAAISNLFGGENR